MTEITIGMTPTEFINALNTSFSEFYGTVSYTTIGSSSTIGDLNENFIEYTVSNGQHGLSFINTINSELNAQYDKETYYMGLGFCANICWFSGVYYAGYPGNLSNLDFFLPTSFPDIDEWLDTCVVAGMKYVSFPAKCEDGFCLWPTEFTDEGYDPCSVEYSAWGIANGKPDFVQMVLDGCNERGLRLSLYFSIYDKTHEVRSGTNSSTGKEAYNAMIISQVTELVNNYPNLLAIWFDDWQWRISYSNIPYKPVFDAIKAVQPNCLILNNEHFHPKQNGQIEVYEVPAPDGNVALGNSRFSEEIKSIRGDGKWWWSAGDDQSSAAFMTKTQINNAVSQANSRNSNYVLAITPDDAGKLPSAQKTLLESLQT